MGETIEMDAQKPVECASCHRKTDELSEVVDPQNPPETIWVCDRCIKKHNYVLAAYAKEQSEQG
jgi:ribosomal protein L37AE/L43A